ncbi:MAG: BCD family MFS transporter [Cyanobacteria bacterium P01_E01_bin.42]
MTTPNLSELQSPPPSQPLPKINLWTMFRLGLFQLGLGIMSLLTLGVLNRIMIDELKVLPIIAAGAIAMHQLVSPARVWFGQMSDAKPLLGKYRTSYVWLGTLAFTSLSFIALQIVWQIGQSLQITGWTLPTYLWSVLLALIFALYGFALSASSTPFAALLVDVSDDDNRSKLVGIVWSMLMIGIVVGAIVSSRLLEQPEICGREILSYNPAQSAKIVDIAQLQATINPVFIIMPAIVFGLCLLATFGIEEKYSRYGLRSTIAEQENQITLSRAIAILRSNRQTGLFFSFLIILTLSIFMQDSVMEPYGGEVFGMCIADTTKLNVPFGMGTLFGISGTGLFLISRLGKKKTTNAGCVGSAIAFGFIILSGGIGNASLLKSSLLLLGLSSGMITAGATSLMLDLTAAETAGTFIGAWGLAQAMARGLATLLGGAVLNLGKLVFTQSVWAYASVFVLQAVGMFVAIWMLGKVNIREFKENARQAIAKVMEAELD